MKKFTKDTLVSIVEDGDRRVAEYRACGWKEETLNGKPLSVEDEMLDNAVNNAINGEPDDGRKNDAPREKVNTVIKANETAAAESMAVDDGLIKREGK